MRSPAKKPISARANATQVARHFGVTPQHIGRLSKEGIISMGVDGRYDLDASRLAYLRHLRARRSTKSENDTEFRRLKSRELTLRIAKQEGSLIDLEECLVLTEGLIGSFRAGLAGLPSRITGEMTLRAQIETACDVLLTQLSDDAQRKSKLLQAGQSLIEAEAGNDLDDEEE